MATKAGILAVVKTATGERLLIRSAKAYRRCSGSIVERGFTVLMRPLCQRFAAMGASSGA